MIAPDQATTWAAGGESESLELTRGTGQRREAARAACAMLNHRGSRVLFGVEPDGRAVGHRRAAPDNRMGAGRPLGASAPRAAPSGSIDCPFRLVPAEDGR